MMTPNQLPPLPVPKFTETIRGVPCITLTEHEHLMREYALQARAQVQGEVFGYIHHFDTHDERGVLIDTTWEADGSADPLPHPTFPSMWKWSHCTPFYTTPQPTQVQGELDPYDAGLLNDFGGGNVEWWQDYIRAELGRAHDFYQSQLASPQAAQATQVGVTDEQKDFDDWWDKEKPNTTDAYSLSWYSWQARAQVRGEACPTCGETEPYTGSCGTSNNDTKALCKQPAHATQTEVTDEREAFESCALMEGSLFKRRADDPDKYWDGNVQDDWELWQARAILAQRPERVPMTDEQISLEAHNADDRDWNDLRFRSSWHEGFLEGARFAEAHHGITAQAKKEGA